MIQSSFFEAGNGGVLDCAILYRSTTVLLHPPAPLGKSPEIVVVRRHVAGNCRRCAAATSQQAAVAGL